MADDSKPLKQESAEQEARRRLPAVGALCDSPRAAGLLVAWGRQAVTEAIRAELAALRTDPAGLPASSDLATYVLEAAEARLSAENRGTLERCINATGVVIHTNLGRAPLAAEARAAMAEAAGYANLDLDLATGERGSRRSHFERLLSQITGAEAGFAVNNCAGAVLATLAAVAAPGSVIASRGELVEIGGGFRMPDVIRASGARMIEVGTTNRTRLSDYARAIESDTRVLLRTHPSNFRVIGFTGAPLLGELVELARARGVALVEDLGGGALIDFADHGLPPEPTVQASIAAGADLVLFSGDKLMGGPQAGIIVGRRTLVHAVAGHPLARALRLDKASVAALAATLQLYKLGLAESRVPAVRMLVQPAAEIARRARTIANALLNLPGLNMEVLPTEAFAGGGAMPMQPLPSFAVRLDVPIGADELARRLSRVGTPVIARIDRGCLLLDARTIADEEAPLVCAALREALAV